jgi:SAM-dependent methyltransferase
MRSPKKVEPEKRPYVDFYRDEEISPAAQDISDIDLHFGRREALYRHLGIPPGLVRGKSVIEFGIGSGHNALFTSSLGPSRYVLVDANPTGIEQARTLLESYDFGLLRHEIVESLAEDFETDERFDIVICEGIIPWQRDPAAMLRTIAQVAAPGGLVVTTCVDSVGYFAESLRRLIATMVVKPNWTVQENVDFLVPIFEPHLRTIKGMSRSPENWVLDPLLLPEYGPPFSISEAVQALHPTYEVLGASPNFLSDWRWYKNIHGNQAGYNEIAIRSFHENLHNHIDYRFQFAPREEAENLELLAHCRAVIDLERTFREIRDPILVEQIIEVCLTIGHIIRKFSDPTADSLDDFLKVLNAGVKEGISPPNFGRFSPWFGRGEQYLSFVRQREDWHGIARGIGGGSSTPSDG